MLGLHNLCRQEVQSLIDEYKQCEQPNYVDWIEK